MKVVRSTIQKIAAAGLLLAFAVGATAGLLKNASFEEQGSGDERVAKNWKMNDPDEHGDGWGSASRENWRAHEGTWIGTIRGTWAGAGDFGGYWQEAEATAGTTYRVTGQFWSDHDWSAQVQELKLEFWKSDRTEMISATTNAITGTGGELWTEVSVEGIAPEGTAWARAVVTVSGAGESGSLMVDALDLDTTF